MSKTQRTLGNGSMLQPFTGPFGPKESMIKNYNNYVMAAQQPSASRGSTGGLSKTTLQNLDKLRNVRSLTPEKAASLKPQQP